MWDSRVELKAKPLQEQSFEGVRASGPESLHLGVSWEYDPEGEPWYASNTLEILFIIDHWLTWEHLRILPKEFVEVTVVKSVWPSLLELPDPDPHE